MKIKKLWVVTKPTLWSTMDDVCFEIDLFFGLFTQYNGGLNPNDVFGFYDNKIEAEFEAMALLNNVSQGE